MYEITIRGVPLSYIGASLRELKADAAKVVTEELKKVKGHLANLKDETDPTNVAVYAAKAYQHLKNCVAVSATVDIPVSVIHDTVRYMYVLVQSHPLYAESAEMIQLAIALEIIETNPYNWA